MKDHIDPRYLDRYFHKLNSFHPVTKEDYAGLVPVIHLKSFKKGEVIFREGQVCRQFYFILEGAMRSFRLEEDSEVNMHFYFEDDIVSDFYSLIYEKPTHFFLVAMQPCTTLMFIRTEYQPVFSNSHRLTAVSSRFYQEAYFNEKQHSDSFKLMTPEERYQYIIDKQPHLLQRVPLIHLASYLGVRRETLSRIRKKIS